MSRNPENYILGGLIVLILTMIVLLSGCGQAYNPILPKSSPTYLDKTDYTAGIGILAFVVYDAETLKMLSAEVSAIADTWSGRMLCKAPTRSGLVGFETSNGDYTFLIQAEGYETYEDQIYVERNKRTSVSCPMRRTK